MQLLKNCIMRDGRVIDGNILKVDAFLNHQIDINLFLELGREFYRLFSNYNVNKILTIESSGIGIACITAKFFMVPLVFAKKTRVRTLSDEVYSTEVFSYTHERKYDIIVDKKYLNMSDRILIIDDFLANGQAIEGLNRLVKLSRGQVVGAGVVIEKGFQGGGDRLRSEGLKLESLAIIDSMDKSGQIIIR